MKTTYTDEAYRTFLEETAAQLDGKEDYIVEIGTANNSVKLLTAAVGNAIGTFTKKLQAGAADLTVRMFGKGGTARVVAGGVIAQGAKVIGATGGKVVTLPATPGIYKVLGKKLTYGNSADNDRIEILDEPETVVVPTVVTLGNANGVIAALNSTAVNPTKADFDALLAAAETLADDVRAIHAALVANGQILAA